MTSPRVILLILTLSIVTICSPAFANETLPQSVENPDPKVQAKQWFDEMGIDTTIDGFARDVFQIMTGIDQPLSPSANLTVSAGSGLRVGLTF